MKTMVKCIITVIVLTAAFDAYTQKSLNSRWQEILPEEKEAYFRFDKMRISKDTGTPLALYRIGYQVKPGSPLEMAHQYLLENSRILNIKRDLSDLQFTSTRETPGGYHVRFKQYVDGYPVYEGDVVINLDRNNTVTLVMNGYKPLLRLSKTVSQVSLNQATEIAKDYLKVKGIINFEKRETEVFYNQGLTYLVHKINIVPAEDQFGDWEVLIDAMTGKIIKVKDNACYLSPANGLGRVFDPDPLTHARAIYHAGGQFGDNDDNDTDSLVAHIVWRDLPQIEFYNNQYHLEGPYARILDFEAPFKGLFSQSDSVWNFTRYQDAFEATNAYFHVDQFMRYINDTLGYSLMPFQYSGGVRFDPHGLNGRDDSHYLPSTGQIAWGEGGVDDAEDPDALIHELGHGVHDWITNSQISQIEGLSEGCGDYWAASYNRSKGFWKPLDPQYNWVFHWDGHNEFWAGRITNYTATYPTDLVGDVHTDGQILSSTLMQIWDDIGRRVTDENFLEALSMLNTGSNQEDAAQAFLQADVNLHGGANLTAIEHWFSLRGYNVTIPVVGPAGPTNLTAYSDYLTPTSIQLNWEDPTQLANGDPLSPSEFHILLERDGMVIDTIQSGIEQYTDTGLNDGREYHYTIYAKLDSVQIISPVVEAAWIAGGSPIPMPPFNVAIANLGNLVKLTWTNNSVNVDSTPMDDFIGIKLYRDSIMVNSLIRTPADTGRLDSTVFVNNIAGFHNWYLTTIDNEIPQNESIPSQIIITPLNLPIGDVFPVMGVPNPEWWNNDNGEVNDMSLNPPSGLYALNLNGKPDGGDQVDLCPVDLSGQQGSGVVLSYFYQPEGRSNAPDSADSLMVFFKNNLGNWIKVMAYPGSGIEPFQQEVIDLQTAPNGGGTFFHSQFQVRFRNIGTPNLLNPNDDWFIDNVFLGVAAPLIYTSVDSIVFDTTQVDSIARIDFEIDNAGIDTLDVYNIFSTNSEFSVNLNSFSLAAGAGQTLSISFAPSQAGPKDGYIRLVSNDPVQDTLDIYVKGFGQGITDIRKLLDVPREYAVYQNYPNPFNPSTTIYYELPNSGEVNLEVYNLLGQRVRTMVNDHQEAGRHQVIWDGNNDTGSPVASGIYIYRFRTGNYSRIFKMILMK
jgi:predicted small secreted protein